MRGQVAPGGVEREIARLALSQHALATRDLLAVGLSHTAIDRRVTNGRLVTLHRGVYAIGGAPATPERRWAAAVLACGPGAALSHLTAAVNWGLRRSDPKVIDVSVQTRSRRARPGIRIHRPRRLLADDIERRRGIPVTSVARTLLDCASVLGTRQLERMLDEAEYIGVLSVESAIEMLGRAGRHRGAPPLRGVLARHRPGSTRTRSALEEAFLALVRRTGFRQPEVNAKLGPYTIDFLWPRKRVAVETDGRRAHERASARERDYARDAWLHAHGYLPLRFTWTQVKRRPQEVVAALRAALHA